MGKRERVSCGLPGLDQILDQLRLGDNVVWQVDRIEDYQHFVQPFVRRALADNRKIVYLRFGQHPPIIEEHVGIKTYFLEADSGFEKFSTAVHVLAAAEGEEVFYVFDCLSDLLSAWATDLMIGNFFKITCPYLFKLNTTAYFSVLRGRNSCQTIARIRETTQLLLDVYQLDGLFYIHPLKVWNRYSPTMFLPHVGLKEDFIPITSSGETARLFARFPGPGPGDADRKLDYWDHVFMKAQELLARVETGDAATEIEETETVEQLCRMMIGREERLLTLARKHFSLQDLLKLKSRLIGSGFVGGKTVGMLLARHILRNDPPNNWVQWLEPHDSFYIGSDVYYTYLVENDCWNLRLEQKKAENYFNVAAELRQRILEGAISEAIRDQFQQLLDYFGQSPIIVRSSSLLEDGFGNAFAGKYESVFCVNQGTPQDRYHNFEQAVKTIFASTMSEDALTYRWQRGLARSDEQMALLVQRVSGSYHGKYFFPDLAGVAMSYNSYVWKDGMDPAAGMMRLVFGLGTRAVNRVEDDYPRIVPLDQPLLRPDSSQEDRCRFSQRQVDLLDTSSNQWQTESLNTVAQLTAQLPNWELWAARDDEARRKMKFLGYADGEAWVLTFDKLLSDTAFPQIMQRLLKTLEAAYAYPVDIEFTVNFSPDNRMQINLLQCRPLQTAKRSGKTNIKVDLGSRNLFFATRGNFMGHNPWPFIRRIIYIQPEAYSKLSVSDKYQIARLVGRLNRCFRERETIPLMLIGPGRWGTTTPSLGVPVSFAEICNTTVLVEVASPKAGYLPELSFGTHFFQDLVETQIIYVALFPNQEEVFFNCDLLDQAENSLTELLPESRPWEKVIKVINLDLLKKALRIETDWQSRQLVCSLIDQAEKGF